MFEAICDAIHHELRQLDEKYANGVAITEPELKHIDTMAHALKSLATYEAMAGSRATPRYVNRDYDSYRRY